MPSPSTPPFGDAAVNQAVQVGVQLLLQLLGPIAHILLQCFLKPLVRSLAPQLRLSPHIVVQRLLHRLLLLLHRQHLLLLHQLRLS